jgi:hypothetical protein
LLTEVWGDRYRNESGYLRFHFAQLRRQLEIDPARPRHLITEAGIGYRFTRVEDADRYCSDDVLVVRGMAMMTVRPPPGVSSREMEPCMASMNLRAMASPRAPQGC